ncbi:cytidylyltransferase [Gammaproteobacteria bacterium]|jgi:nicotinic acid mononucleotide adenylyltransferase/nicotinamide mononucleotide (NMN) deamidase PncC|nr:cytidylyltransferase [Gammaproteobacteria bacterium]MDC3248117.1 cytidylyltransferase [Gammaproteobacteria bacterium]MDC3301728.1 cytidylyltransferase [Gammaproteobacteria bacterium]
MQELIKKIHQSPFKVTIVSSGGGTEAISSLLQVPGASNTILESYIPYAKESMDAYLNKKPDHYCSMQTCLSMAANAYKSCSKIASKTKSKYLIGISITASLATTYTKIGDHKFYIVLQTSSYTKSVACILDKNTRSRKEEEELIANYVMHLLGEACGIKVEKPSHSENVDLSKTVAEKSWIKLLNNEVNYVSSSKSKPELIFPGSFNPLHEGHIRMRDLAEKKTGMQTTFEICAKNADKPPLTFQEIKRTLDQFDENDSWVMTSAGRFSEKAEMFPNSVFIIGADTLLRVFDEKFYSSNKDMNEHVERFNDHNIHFLVFGRKVKDKFISLEDINIPSKIRSRCTGFNEGSFRDDISSTEIRLSET